MLHYSNRVEVRDFTYRRNIHISNNAQRWVDQETDKKNLIKKENKETQINLKVEIDAIKGKIFEDERLLIKLNEWTTSFGFRMYYSNGISKKKGFPRVVERN